MIHHYTSIQTLALILKHKTIRFNRLDAVDDVQETSGLIRQFGSYVFVSCWTENPEENPALWHMYTGMKGVRISLPNEIFRKYLIKAGDYGNWGFVKDTVCPLPLEKIRTEDYLISTPFWLPNGFYKKVTYTQDFEKMNRNLFQEHDQGLTFNSKDIGKYKHPAWSFQEETRFILSAYPLLPLTHPLIDSSPEKQMEYSLYGVFQNLENPMTFIDVEVDEAVLAGIEVTLGPLCSPADEVIVESLLQEYAENGKWEPSGLNIRVPQRT